ncbi:response regulator [Pseudomonas fluorescens]|uniref:histidine kinase n=1 Tax=Pseudomonas fluorescens TaxID=294 RepID=A0A2N1EB37_PSEFL|nr:response regulator [Pseudomonas fluorescens]PKH24041.1 hybrid sensor histidine kinase/response regulator [Pseudomonas fluorescens]
MKREIQLLIVDDNSATRYALRRRLERHHYLVLEAGTGQEGLDLIATGKIDALILDVNLPDMSGFDIVRRLRTDPNTALLPVVHVSAASIETGDIITGLDAGADAYLIHPIDPEVLLATLRTLLRVRDTEYALRQSEARFREIFFNISAPIAVLDAQLKVHECNHAFAQLIHDNLNPDALLECFAGDQYAVIQELCLRLAAGERWKGTLQMKVDGQLRETEWQISPYDRAELSLVFVEDVTEYRHRERHQQAELANAATRLARTEAQLLQAQKMDALGKLTGGIAHDFNNLLTGIITSLELIKKRIESQRTDKVLGYADAALSSALSAAGLTNRLLAFARQQPLDTRPIDINAHIRSVEELLVRTIGEHITLKLELTNNAAVAMVDPIQLESAVLNLVINARDALPKGGNIWVTTYPAYSNGNLKLEDGPYIALSVRDNGVGIEHSVIDKVFDPFFTTKPVGQGTGLGLSTIYGFARQSGGDAQIRSVTRQGTEVTIMLPAAEGPASVTTRSLAKPGKSKGEHILIVEDMPSVRSFVAEVLADAGYHCSLAADGDEAIAILKTDLTINLLLTDVGLPYMTGRELADFARCLRNDLPILFMTGYAENAANRQNFLGERMDLITKPFHIDELLEKIRQGLEAKS